MKIDWKLKGFNLLKFVCNKSLVLHPETCSNMVLMDHDSDLNLKNWITNSGAISSMEDSLGAWLQHNAAGITVPFATSESAGVVYPSEGLAMSDEIGGLSVIAATENTFGGIKTGYTSIGTTDKPVLLDKSGNAYVTVNESGSSDSIIYRWDRYNPTHIPTTLNPSAYIVSSGDTGHWADVNINDYINSIEELFNLDRNNYEGPALADFRIYPIRADVQGHLYTFVPWTNTTYGTYNNSGTGLVPYSNDTTINTTAFLRKDGSWQIPAYNNLQNKPVAFQNDTTYGHGFVSKPTAGNTGKFLRGDGTWQTPTNTTYSTANHDNPEGLLNVSDTIADSTAALADNSSSPTTYTDQFIPVVYNENNKIHGVSLKLILDTILDSNNKDMLRTLAQAIADDNDGTPDCSVEILKAVINP